MDAKIMLAGVVLLMGTIIRDKSIELEYSLSDKPIMVSGDTDQLEQVFINLIKNAIEALATVSKKKIDIVSEVRDSMVNIRIRDSGPGVAMELRDQIFIPFYTTKDEGCGIGLSLCRQIIYQHGGTIRANYPEEGGAEFIVTLPLQENNSQLGINSAVAG
ncbi:MAG: GHKL domain-containing protein [Saprospiraceae bacterium]|nr:GHKL domain-containing protein [Saprospiraceae bacterium]